MITLEEWAEVRRLRRAEGVSIREIVRRLGLARNTVRAVRADVPPRVSVGRGVARGQG